MIIRVYLNAYEAVIKNIKETFPTQMSVALKLFMEIDAGVQKMALGVGQYCFKVVLSLFL